MSEHKVEIYTKQGCRFSQNARTYLTARNIDFDDIDIASDEARQEMLERSGGKTSTPQIFIEGQHLGGYDDLVQSGVLERFRQQ